MLLNSDHARMKALCVWRAEARGQQHWCPGLSGSRFGCPGRWTESLGKMKGRSVGKLCPPDSISVCRSCSAFPWCCDTADHSRLLTGHCLQSSSLVGMEQGRVEEMMPYLTFSRVNFGLKKQIEVGRVQAV